MKRFVLLLAFAVAASAPAQTIVTRCQTEDVKINKYTVRRLVGCSEGFAEDTLWHLDRLDSRDGSLDGEFTRSKVAPSAAVVYVADTGVEPTHDEFQFAEGTNVIGGITPHPPFGHLLPSPRGEGHMALAPPGGERVAEGRMRGISPSPASDPPPSR